MTTNLFDVFVFYCSSVSQEGGLDHSTPGLHHSLCQSLLTWKAAIDTVHVLHFMSHTLPAPILY